MAIYDKPVRLLMRDMADAFGLKAGQEFTQDQAVSWFGDNYPDIKKPTITAHLIRLAVNNPNRLHHNIKRGEDDLFFRLGVGRYRLFDEIQDHPPIHFEGPGPEPVIIDQPSVPQGSTEFAYEKDLRSYLSKNLGIIENGLKLYFEDGVSGIEYNAGGRFIDILAVDSEENFVVLELKVSKGYDRVVGQLMRYMAWVTNHKADKGQKVRGVIIAREISNDLILACSLLEEVRLFEYEMSLKLREAKGEG